MKKHPHYRTWVEIDTKAIEENTETLKKILSGKLLMSVVKSNAYGHGMTLSARAVLSGGADMLAVDDIDEALELRREGVKAPILVLGYIMPARFREAVMKNISITISSITSLEELMLQEFSRKPRIHIKFETGLHRQGIPDSDMDRLLSALTSRRWRANVEGVYTHFAAMESPTEKEYSRRQIKSFETCVKMLRERGFEPLRHVSASSGILFSPDFHFDVARAGIATYGLWPSPEIRAHARGVILRPALAWKSIVTEVKSVKRGERVGYDLTHTLTRDSRIAVIPVGYWHGLPRSLSNIGSVLVRGKHAPIVGRISMDMTIVDVTGITGVVAGDTVTLIGTDGPAVVSAEDMATKAGTINYEIVTRINPLIERIEI
jgi:alanine racemase